MVRGGTLFSPRKGWLHSGYRLGEISRGFWVHSFLAVCLYLPSELPIEDSTPWLPFLWGYGAKNTDLPEKSALYRVYRHPQHG